MNLDHQRFCEKLSRIIGLTKDDVFHAYDQWKRDGLIERILQRDEKAITQAKTKYTWYGKQKPQLAQPRHTMNAFQKRMANIEVMAAALKAIGSLEDAQEALDTFK